MRRTAVITGATKGIGRAIAEALWAEGFSLAVCARSHDDLAAMAEVFKSTEKDFLWRSTDVGDRDALAAFSAMVANRWQSVDVLVNNAGLFVPGSILTAEEGALEESLQSHVLGAWHLTRMLFPALQQSVRAHIFNMCSISSLIAHPSSGSYTVAKFALLGLTRALRDELRDQNISVTAIIPGATWSDSWKGADYPDDRLMQPADIAQAVLAALRMGPSAVLEEIIIRPQKGDL